MRCRPKNWSEFQHYKDRNPTWIKLHKRLLDDYEFQCLPLASRALAPMLWLIASEDHDGWFDADIKKIAFRVHAKPAEVEIALKALIDSSFLELEQDASNTLADCKRDAIPERQVTSEVTSQVREDKSSLRSDLGKRPRKQKSSLPDPCPNDLDLQWAKNLWAGSGRTDLSLAGESDKFRDHHRARATLSADWPASWRTWARNALKFNGASNGRRDRPNAHENFAAGALLAAEEYGRNHSGD